MLNPEDVVFQKVQLLLLVSLILMEDEDEDLFESLLSVT